MHYLKSIAKNVYEKVLEDEYLQQLTEQNVYSIINLTSRVRTLSVNNDNRKLSTNQPQKDLFEKVDLIGSVSPEREFRIIGSEPKVQVISSRLRDLQQDLWEVTELMKENFGKYQRRINYSIAEIDGMKSLNLAKLYSSELRNKLENLTEASSKSKKITMLNIRAQNIKRVLKIIQSIPNIKKMTLTQLKKINLEKLNTKVKSLNLQCLMKISDFVQNAVNIQLAQVIHILKQCLINQFQEVLYENTLKDFIIAQHQTIKYQNLLIRLVQNQIHNVETDMNCDILQICKTFIRLMINLHSVFRWHREHEQNSQWKNLSIDHFGMNIQINVNNITKRLVLTMDEKLKDAIQNKYYTKEINPQNLSNLYFVCRMSQIGYTFSGEYFQKSLKSVTQIMNKNFEKSKEKAFLELEETFKNQQRNSWNRLPVVDDYSHQQIDRNLYQIYCHRKSEAYGIVINTFQNCKPMFKNTFVKINYLRSTDKNVQIQANLWDSLWVKENSNQEIKHKSNSKNNEQLKKQNSQDDQKQDTKDHSQSSFQIQMQTWQIQSVNFGHFDKYQKHKMFVKLKHLLGHNHQTVICQHSLNVLKNIEIFARHAFYFSIEPMISQCMNAISTIMQNYIYQVFNNFLSAGMKYAFFEEFQNLDSLEKKYHKKRFHFQYPNISLFILNFRKAHKITYRDVMNHQQISPVKHSISLSSQSINSGSNLRSSTDLNQPQNLQNVELRSRVVALQSFQYILRYFSHIMHIDGFYNQKSQTHQQNGNSFNFHNSSIYHIHKQTSIKIGQKIKSYSIVISELSEILYTDCIPKLFNTKNTHTFVASIPWGDQENKMDDLTQIFKNYCKDFYHKITLGNRGEVPEKICEKLFGIYWKTQLTVIMKSFLGNFSTMKNSNNFVSVSKHRLQKFIDDIFEGLCEIVKQKQYILSHYQKFKALFPILFQRNFETAFNSLKESLDRYEFIYAVQLGTLLVSDSCCHLGKQQLNDKKKRFEEHIQNMLVSS